MSRIVIASSNAGKIAEFAAILGTRELVPQATLGIGDADECGLSFVENALIKARHAARASGLAAIADDSGLCVPALGGAPGLFSARYAGTHGDDAANNARLLHDMAGFEDAAREAFFICVIAFVADADDPAPRIAEGRWHGRVLEAPRGAQGFGYDPIFQPAGKSLSAAELGPRKHAISHRAIALGALARHLEPSP